MDKTRFLPLINTHCFIFHSHIFLNFYFTGQDIWLLHPISDAVNELFFFCVIYLFFLWQKDKSCWDLSQNKIGLNWTGTLPNESQRLIIFLPVPPPPPPVGVPTSFALSRMGVDDLIALCPQLLAWCLCANATLTPSWPSAPRGW